MHFSKIRIAAVIAALACFSFAGPATAISVGLYSLSNHPDGSEAKNGGRLYGLRLDGLGSGNGLAFSKWTFDFDAAGSNMMMDYDGSSIRIFGTTIGGVDNNGADYAGGTAARWAIDMTYSIGVSESANGGIVDTKVSGGHVNFGTMRILDDNSYFSAGTLFDLRDHGMSNTGENALALQLGDRGGAGHRGFDGISGWGWVDHRTATPNDTDGFEDHPSDTKKVSPIDGVAGCCSDWLFTANPVSLPEPGSLALFVIGAAGISVIRRRRKD